MTDEQTDKVYREFFRSEMPAELPPLALSEPARLPKPDHRSRYTLAAAVLALAALGLWLSGQMRLPQPAPSPSNLMKHSEADGKKIIDAAKDGDIPELPMP